MMFLHFNHLFMFYGLNRNSNLNKSIIFGIGMENFHIFLLDYYLNCFNDFILTFTRSVRYAIIAKNNFNNYVLLILLNIIDHLI